MDFGTDTASNTETASHSIKNLSHIFNYYHDLLLNQKNNQFLLQHLYDNKDILEFLVDSQNRNLLYAACVYGNYQIANELIRLCPYLAHKLDNEGYLPLHAAAQQGNLDQFQNVWNVFPHAAVLSSHNGRVPLHFASQQGHFNVCQLILSKYPECAEWVAHEDGRLPIHLAASSGSLQVVKLLLSYYPESVKVPTLDGYLPIMIAVEQGHLELVTYFYEFYPASLHHKDSQQRTPLFLAIYSNQISILKYFCSGLIIEDIIMTVHPTTQRNILHEMALMRTDLVIFQMILQGVYRKELCQQIDCLGYLPLHMAAQSG